MRNGPDTDERDLDLCFAVGGGELSGFVDRIEAYATAMALPANVAARLSLVCEEWAANVFKHGAGPDGATALRLSVRHGAAVLHVAMEDDGPPFDPLTKSAPDTAASLDQRGPGGLGLHLMRQVARRLHYERVDSTNRLKLVLEFDP